MEGTGLGTFVTVHASCELGVQCEERAVVIVDPRTLDDAAWVHLLQLVGPILLVILDGQ